MFYEFERVVIISLYEFVGTVFRWTREKGAVVEVFGVLAEAQNAAMESAGPFVVL